MEYDAWLNKQAKKMRNNPTPAEQRFKEWAKSNKINCYNQYVYKTKEGKGYILDFYFPKHKIAVEIDGSVHNTVTGRYNDNRKELDLWQEGVYVIRLWNKYTTKKILNERFNNKFNYAKEQVKKRNKKLTS